MRTDQLERLRKLQENLIEVFLVECDEKKWPKPDTRDGRGDRYWCKKNAQASLSIAYRIENLLALRDGRSTGEEPKKPETDDEASLEREIRDAEREAAALGRNVVQLIRKRKAKG